MIRSRLHPPIASRAFWTAMAAVILTLPADTLAQTANAAEAIAGESSAAEVLAAPALPAPAIVAPPPAVVPTNPPAQPAPTPVAPPAPTPAQTTAVTANPVIARLNQAIAKQESRSIGMPANREIEQAVVDLFGGSGCTNGVINFANPAFLPGETQLLLGAAKTPIRLLPMHPTLYRPGNFTEPDLQMRLVYLGQGLMTDLKYLEGPDLQDTVAVMEFDCGMRWLDFMRFGVKGFIFLGGDRYDYQQSLSKIYNTEVGVPRFFLPAGTDANHLREACGEGQAQPSARITSQPSRIVPIDLRDAWVLIEGDDPTLRGELVIFTANLDANSVVPELAVGSQSAGNLRLLMQLYDQFTTHRPARSILLVAVNGHTQNFLGERLLAWHLLAPRTALAELRDDIAIAMRNSRLYATAYATLKLEPVAMDANELHHIVEVMKNILGAQNAQRRAAHKMAVQASKARREPQKTAGGDTNAIPYPQEPDRVLDMESITLQDIQTAIDIAHTATVKALNGLQSRLSADEEGLASMRADVEAYAALRNLPEATLLERMHLAKSTFDDEQIFELWRGSYDESTGIRIMIKEELQDEAMRQKNELGQDLLDLGLQLDTLKKEEASLLRERTTTTNETQRARIDARLTEIPVSRMAATNEINRITTERKDRSKVLNLFNKVDIGLGRSRTHYRTIAANPVWLAMLREYRDDLVAKHTLWLQQRERILEHDLENDRIYEVACAKNLRLILSLDANWNSEQYGFCTLTPASLRDWSREFGQFTERLLTEARAAGETPPLINTLASSGGKPQEYYFRYWESAITHFMSARATPALTLRGAFTDLGLAFSPVDFDSRRSATDEDAARAGLLPLLTRLATHPQLSDRATFGDVVSDPRTAVASTLIRTFEIDTLSAKVKPTLPVPGTIVLAYAPGTDQRPTPPLLNGDVVNAWAGISGETGDLVLHGLNQMPLATIAYQLDPQRQTTVLYTIDKGQIQASKQQNSNLNRDRGKILPMFPCTEIPIFDRVDPTMIPAESITLQDLWVKSGLTKSDPKKYGLHGIDSLSSAKSPKTVGPVAAYLWQRDAGNAQDKLILLTRRNSGALNPTEKEPLGSGYGSAAELGNDFFLRVTQDLEKLNRYRVGTMKGVANSLVDQFIADGSKALTQAEEALKRHDYVTYVRELYRAQGNQFKAYRQLAATTSDMLKAIIVYMALMLPFCFFLQKLIFNSTRLEQDLLGFVGLFVGTYIVFRLIHPAFAIARSSEAIFIAFVLGAVGVFITWILNGRFKTEMKLIFQTTAHTGSSVGYGVVGSTAMMIGVNNMKRRRIRTTLTTATIVLVVFTMLAFSSVSKKVRPTLIAKSAEAAYSGFFFHQPGGGSLDEATVNVLRNLYASKGDILIRRQLLPPEALNSALVTWRMKVVETNGTEADIEAAVGLPQLDRDFLGPFPLIQGRYFSSDEADEIMIGSSLAEALGIAGRDNVQVALLGRLFRIVGHFDDTRFGLLRDLNPVKSLIPRQPATKLGIQTAPAATDGEENESLETSAALIETTRLVLLPERTAARLGAAPSSVSIRFPLGIDGTLAVNFWEEANSLFTLTDARFFLASSTPFAMGSDTRQLTAPGAYYVGSSYRTSIGGMSRLLIPLLIAGLIIFNTMLGTVYERRSEIAVYNAVGLNPTHIFMFFLAEALVYSFIGAIGGYLIGQVLAIAAQATHLVQGINVNFSSLIVVYAILFTVGLVLLSTLYPAYLATRTAVPSGKRTWSLPPHDGQHMHVAFPFIYQPKLAAGVMFYLYEYFQQFTEESIGDQLVILRASSITQDEMNRDVYHLAYDVALAPYDLGVTQTVAFETRFDNNVDSYRLFMENNRVSGQDTNWVTTNKPFLEKLRYILIRWRNIDATRHRWYVEEGQKLFSEHRREAPLNGNVNESDQDNVTDNRKRRKRRR